MNKIISKKLISKDLVKFEIITSIQLNHIKPGQYIILKIENNDPGIPVPVLKTDLEKETITVIIYDTDSKTRQLTKLNSGSELFSIEGPFGNLAQITNYGTVFCIGRGSGIVLLLPILSALRKAGNRIFTVLSAQTKDGIILENEVNAVSDETLILTDDKSYGEKGSVCQALGEASRNNRINQVFVIGTSKSIKETFSHASRFGIPIQSVLYLGKTVENGLHGIFKVTNCGTMNAVCVDGFNFNAHYPNFEELIRRFESDELEIPQRLTESHKLNIPV